MKNESTGFTNKELSYIDELQSKADAEVANPASQFYKPQPEKRRTAARQLMTKWEEERAEKDRLDAL